VLTIGTLYTDTSRHDKGVCLLAGEW
jgi:hypothetical protein